MEIIDKKIFVRKESLFNWIIFNYFRVKIQIIVFIIIQIK